MPTTIATARGKRRRDAQRCVDARDRVDDGDTDPHRGLFPGTGDRHQPGHALGHLIESGRELVRAHRAETTDAHHDEPWILLLERVGIEPHVGQYSRTEVLDQHICVEGQAAKQFPPAVTAHVDGDRPFAAVHGSEVEASIAVERRPLTRTVAGATGFDLDHVGAEVREQRRAQRPRESAGEVENFDTAEQLVHGRNLGSVVCNVAHSIRRTICVNCRCSDRRRGEE